MGPPPGTLSRIGPYVLLERVGTGGMAEIFVAKKTGSHGFERLVALKRILPRYAKKEVYATLLIQEAKVAARILHPNVVQVIDLGEVDGEVYIAMELVRGSDLAAVLSHNFRRRERVPLRVAIGIAIELLSGLDYAHRLTDETGRPLGIIHRDVSPQNVLISLEGEVKIGDFGIARILQAESFDVPGGLRGKYGYMSPEQLSSLPLDARSDVFSAGVVLYELLTGERLFPGATPAETVRTMLDRADPAPSAKNPEVPPALDTIVRAALVRSRDGRTASAQALLFALLELGPELRASRLEIGLYMRRQFSESSGASEDHFPQRGLRALYGLGADGRAAPRAAPPPGRPRLGELLVDRGTVSPRDVALALERQAAAGGRLGEVLAAMGLLSEVELAEAIAAQAEVPLLSRAEIERRRPALDGLRSRYSRALFDETLVLPAVEREHLVLVVADPYDARSTLKAKLALASDQVALRLATRSDLRAVADGWLEDAAVLVDDDAIVEQVGVGAPPEPYGTARRMLGSLSEISVLDLFRSLAEAAVTARVTLEEGAFFVADGRLVHAVAGAKVGEEAFFRLAAAAGEFAVDYEVRADARSVGLDNTALMIELLLRAEAPVTREVAPPPAEVAPVEPPRPAPPVAPVEGTAAFPDTLLDELFGERD